jgi:hypothetical protein
MIWSVGKRSAKSQMARVADLTRHHWQGRWHPEGDDHCYDRCIPIVTNHTGPAARTRPGRVRLLALRPPTTASRC